MLSITQKLLLGTASLAVAIPLLWRPDVNADTKALVLLGRSRPPTLGRKIAVAFLTFGFVFGYYAEYVKTQSLISIAVTAPLLTFILLFSVISSRVFEKFFLRPFVIYLAGLAIAGVGFVSIPCLWQAFSTETIQPVWPPSSIDVPAEKVFVFWWSVFAYCVLIGYVIACLRLYLICRRLRVPLFKYDPSFESTVNDT
jgi:hypothetical protein